MSNYIEEHKPNTAVSIFDSQRSVNQGKIPINPMYPAFGSANVSQSQGPEDEIERQKIDISVMGKEITISDDPAEVQSHGEVDLRAVTANEQEKL